MILNTLEKRGLGGFPGEETHFMPLTSDKGKATLEGTKAFIPAYFSAGGNKTPVLCVGFRGDPRLMPWLWEGLCGFPDSTLQCMLATSSSHTVFFASRVTG